MCGKEIFHPFHALRCAFIEFQESIHRRVVVRQAPFQSIYFPFQCHMKSSFAAFSSASTLAARSVSSVNLTPYSSTLLAAWIRA